MKKVFLALLAMWTSCILRATRPDEGGRIQAPLKLQLRVSRTGSRHCHHREKMGEALFCGLETQPSEPKTERIRVRSPEVPAFLWHPQSHKVKGTCLLSFSRLREREGIVLSVRQEGGAWVQDQRWLQVTGVGSLGKGKDFTCKMHSSRPSKNLIPGREWELQGPQRGPGLAGGRADDRQKARREGTEDES